MRVLLSSFLLYILFHFPPAIWGLSRVAVWCKNEWHTAGGARLTRADIIWYAFFWGMTDVQSWLVSSRTLLWVWENSSPVEPLMPALSFPDSYSS